MIISSSKGNSLKKLKKHIEEELIGAYLCSLRMDINSFDVMKIKGWLNDKAKEKTGSEREFYNKLSTELTKNNLSEIAKEFDSHIYKKNKQLEDSLKKEKGEENRQQMVRQTTPTITDIKNSLIIESMSILYKPLPNMDTEPSPDPSYC